MSEDDENNLQTDSSIISRPGRGRSSSIVMSAKVPYASQVRCFTDDNFKENYVKLKGYLSRNANL